MSSEEQFFLVKPVHDILYVDMAGTWNKEQALAYTEEYKKQVSRYFAREWACVLNLQNLEMLLPETFQIETLRALNTWSFIKGMKAIAVIVSADNRSHLLYQLEEVFKGANSYATAVCHSEVEANHWLVECGFSENRLSQSQQSA